MVFHVLLHIFPRNNKRCEVKIFAFLYFPTLAIAACVVVVQHCVIVPKFNQLSINSEQNLQYHNNLTFYFCLDYSKRSCKKQLPIDFPCKFYISAYTRTVIGLSKCALLTLRPIRFAYSFASS